MTKDSKSTYCPKFSTRLNLLSFVMVNLFCVFTYCLLSKLYCKSLWLTVFKSFQCKATRRRVKAEEPGRKKKGEGRRARPQEEGWKQKSPATRRRVKAEDPGLRLATRKEKWLDSYTDEDEDAQEDQLLIWDCIIDSILHLAHQQPVTKDLLCREAFSQNWAVTITYN